MTDKEKLIDAFCKSDARGRIAILRFAQGMAEDWPSDLPSAVGLTGGELDNLEATALVSTSKKIK